MKIPSDKLHRLVRSLTPAEKRYFRIFIRGKTDRDSKYLYLFELLEKNETIEEEVLRKKIYKSQVVEGKKFTELKAYLYDLILKCLQSYEEQRSVSYRLNHLLQSVTVLFNRGLYEDCKEMLGKAIKIAKRYESFPHTLEILRWEKQLAYVQMDVNFLHQHLERLQYEEERVQTQLRNVTAYRKAFFQVYTAIKREAQHREANRMTQLKAILAQDIFKNPDLADSHTARVYYYRTLNLYHYATQENARFYETGIQLLALLEAQAHFLQENLSDYIAALSNLILSCGLMGKFEEVRICLDKLRRLTPNTKDDRQKIHRQYYTNLFAFCTYTGAFEEARQEMEQCRKDAEGLDQHSYETVSFINQYCIICLGCGDYNSALDYLNQWMSAPRSVEREDLQSLARILSLILHFEMGNHVLLDSLLRSTTRFMQIKNRYYELERRFIQGIAEALKWASPREQQVVFQKMKTDLQTPQMGAMARTLLQMFDLDAWLESKISGRTFAACVKARWLEEQKK